MFLKYVRSLILIRTTINKENYRDKNKLNINRSFQYNRKVRKDRINYEHLIRIVQVVYKISAFLHISNR